MNRSARPLKKTCKAVSAWGTERFRRFGVRSVPPIPGGRENPTWGRAMKRLLASTLATGLVLSAATAHAGGPIIIEEEEVPVVEERPASSAGILPLLLIPIILCVALCGGDDDEEEGPTSPGITVP